MYLIYYHIEEGRGYVYMAQEIQEAPSELLENSCIVEDVPVAKIVTGKVSQLYMTLETKELYYEYKDRPLTKEEEMQKQIDDLKAQLEALK